MLSNLECATCHARLTQERTIQYAGPDDERPQGVGAIRLRGIADRLAALDLQRRFAGERVRAARWRMWTVPWSKDDARLAEQFQAMGAQEIAGAFINPHGVVARANGSLFYGTRVPDLHLLRYNRYADATGTHRLRGPQDVARYGALVCARLSGWFEGAGTDEYQRTVQTYYGPQAADDLLERTTWHAGQHLRQLYVLADRLGVKPPAPLPADALAGLPLPEALW